MSQVYEWTKNMAPLLGVPMFDHDVRKDLPSEFHPRESYDKKLIELAALIADNFKKYNLSRIESPTNEQAEDIERLASMQEEYLKSIFLNVEILKFSFEDYVALHRKVYVNHQPKDVKKNTSVITGDSDLLIYDNQYNTIEIPFVANHLEDDELFAYWRLAGNNPLALKGVKSIPEKFPITNEQYQSVMGEGDSLYEALSQGRLYMLDYENLDGSVAEGGVYKPESDTSATPVPGYSYMAIAMFSVEKNTGKFLPVAIQCGQAAKDDNPLFFPSDDEDYRWGWQRAKLVVHAADKAEHQLSRHLGITHLISEVFSLATLRNFKKEHPLYKLLISHTEGTNRVNHNAIVALLQPQKFVDNLIAGDLGGLAQKTIDSRLSFDFYDNFLPTELEKRNVNDTSILKDYPYRDDGLLLWEAIREWVGEYIHLTYPGDLQLNSDQSLQSWMQDIVDNGAIKGFRVVATRDDLSDLLTMVIFTASVQHAAVNYPQHDYMMYAPAYMGTLAAPKPTYVSGNTKQQWLDMLPGELRSGLKITIYTFLSGIYNGFLGEYVYANGDDIFSEGDDIAVYEALTKFRSNLVNIEEKIKERNATRYHPYETLFPSKVPASVNI